MIRGTTAPFEFEIPYPFGEITYVKAMFWQNDNAGTFEAPLPIIKEYDTRTTPPSNDGFASGDNGTLTITLTPEETWRFSDQKKAFAQVQIFYGARNLTVASREKSYTVYPVKNDEFIGNVGTPTTNDNSLWILDAGEIV